MKYVDDFSQSLSLDPPNIPVQVSANPRMNIFVNDLEHPITIEDIGVTNSLTSGNNRFSFRITVSNTCIFSFLII